VVRLVVTGGNLTRRPQSCFLVEVTWQINEYLKLKKCLITNHTEIYVTVLNYKFVYVNQMFEGFLVYVISWHLQYELGECADSGVATTWWDNAIAQVGESPKIYEWNISIVPCNRSSFIAWVFPNWLWQHRIITTFESKVFFDYFFLEWAIVFANLVLIFNSFNGW